MRRFGGRLPEHWDEDLPTFPASKEGLATRKASEAVLQSLAAGVPELVGGSGDLDASTFTWLKGYGDLEPPSRPPPGAQGAAGGTWSYAGRNIHFGVREHAMGAAVNGLSYHGGFIPFGATFLVFHDYMRPPVRISAIARLGSIWVYTHDSIGVGEDGPTHQPVEHLAALRAIPDLVVIRPCDANETRWAWQMAVERWPSRSAAGRRCWCSPARRCPRSIATCSRRRACSVGALMCSPAMDPPMSRRSCSWPADRRWR
ncbi:hypothetical protein WME89_42550 [Sorangium sp. So ce321]